MSERKVPRANNLPDFIEMESQRILSACIECGKCFEVCPMIPFGGMSKAELDGGTVVHGVLNMLKDEKGSPEAVAWASVCNGCGVCVPECPEQVDPLMMLRVARMKAAGGSGNEVQIPLFDDPLHFSRVRAYAQMQLSEDQVEDWL